MAVVVFKSKDENFKPKKEYIDLSVEHKKIKETSKTLKILFFPSLVLNIILSILYLTK